MKTCKKCGNRIESMADKDAESVIWRGNKMVNVFYPSKVADHGYCGYHHRKKYYGDIHEAVLRARMERNKNHYDKLRHLIKIGGQNGRTYPDSKV